MLSNVIIQLAEFLQGKKVVTMHVLPEIGLKFDLLLAPPPNPKHTANATQGDKANAEMGLHMLKSTQEGAALIRDLNILQNKGGRKRFDILFVFGSMPLDELTGEPRAAEGFADMEDPESPGEIRKDVRIYARYRKDASRTEFIKGDDSGAIGTRIFHGSTMMAMTVFHELLHVYYVFGHMDLDNTGHWTDENGNVQHDEVFGRRLNAFIRELEVMEKKLRQK